MSEEKELEKLRKERLEAVLNAKVCKKCGKLIREYLVIGNDGYYHLECIKDERRE